MMCNVCQQMFDYLVFKSDHVGLEKLVKETNWTMPFPIAGRENQPMLHYSSIRALQESRKTCELCFLIESTRRENPERDFYSLELGKDLDQKPFDFC
jgi:hypothetical protein